MQGPGKSFRILSLDGGGIRGAFIAGFLAEIEKHFGCRIAEHFDLLAGTSTGAIIAAALAVHEPAERIVEFYRDHGPMIFARRSPLPANFATTAAISLLDRYLRRYGIDCDQLRQSKYASTRLKSALEEVFGDRTLGESTTRVVIPAVDLTRGQTIVFKTPHLPGLYRDRHYRIVDVLMATTAAPTYFPHAVIEAGSAYVDGGMWANNPSMIAIVESLKISQAANRPDLDSSFTQDTIQLLSVGTGKASYFHQPPADGAGIMWWAPHLFDVSSVSQSQGVNFQAQYMLGSRVRRIDYDLPDGTWSLDKIDMLSQMIQIGRQRCFETVAELGPIFFSSSADHRFHPFPDAPQKGRCAAITVVLQR